VPEKASGKIHANSYVICCHNSAATRFVFQDFEPAPNIFNLPKKALENMPAGKKRASEGTTSTRAAKVAKTDDASGSKSKGTASKAAKAVSIFIPCGASSMALKTLSSQAANKMALDEFKGKAMPIHVHITHTPPSVAEKPASGGSAKTSKDKTNATQPNRQSDPGHIGSVTLVPSGFSTGSYGWKGTKRVAIELEDEDGKKQKVMVMININAVVAGSKDKEEKEEDEDKGGEKNEEAEANDEDED
jgi:hypothetical protein